MRRIFIIVALVLAVLATGCKQQESSPPLVPQNLPSGGGSIVFNDEIKTLDAVLEKNPKDLSALIRQGNLYMDTKRYGEAVALYQRALEIDPGNQNVRVDMGTCYRYLETAQSYQLSAKMLPKAYSLCTHKDKLTTERYLLPIIIFLHGLLDQIGICQSFTCWKRNIVLDRPQRL